MKTISAPASAKPTHEQIAALAYKLYEQNGHQSGQEMENWLKAEQQLTQQARDIASANAARQQVESQKTAAMLPPPNQHTAATRDEVRQHQVHPAARQSRRSERS